MAIKTRITEMLGVEYCGASTALRDDLPNGELFFSLADPGADRAWRRHFNAVRPHSSLRENGVVERRSPSRPPRP